MGLCVPCIPSAGEQHPALAGCVLGLLGTAGCSVPCWLLQRVAAHSSPLTRVMCLLGQCNTFDGASVPLPREYEKENFATSVCCGRTHQPADVLEAREEVNSSSVRQHSQTSLAQPHGSWNITVKLLPAGGQEGWGWRRHELGKRDR